MPAQMNQADAGDDLMCPALQPRQHPFRVGGVGRFAHDFAVEKHQRVRAEHERVGKFLGDDARLAMGVELADFERRQLFVQNFRGVAGDDLKFQLQLPQQFRAARRRGSENQWCRFHDDEFKPWLSMCREREHQAPDGPVSSLQSGRGGDTGPLTRHRGFQAIAGKLDPGIIRVRSSFRFG